MQYVVNIFELSRQVFGIKGVSLQQLVDPRSIDYDNQENNIVEENEKATVESALGLPVIESLRVKNPETEEWLEFEDAPAIISINLAKNIVSNEINGKQGTVKEYTNTGDYVITVRGMIVKDRSEDLDYERIDKLHQLEKINEMLEVESNLLNTLGVNHIVIKETEHPGAEGFTNVYPFIWTCLSDKEYVLNLDANRNVASFDSYDVEQRRVFGL